MGKDNERRRFQTEAQYETKLLRVRDQIRDIDLAIESADDITTAQLLRRRDELIVGGFLDLYVWEITPSNWTFELSQSETMPGLEIRVRHMRDTEDCVYEIPHRKGGRSGQHQNYVEAALMKVTQTVPPPPPILKLIKG